MEREIVYLCATHEKFPQKMAFGFLREIMVEWNKTYSRFDCVRAAPEEMTDDFKPVFTKKMVSLFAMRTRCPAIVLGVTLV